MLPHVGSPWKDLNSSSPGLCFSSFRKNLALGEFLRACATWPSEIRAGKTLVAIHFVWHKITRIRWHFDVVEQLHNGGKAEKMCNLLDYGISSNKVIQSLILKSSNHFLVFEGRKLPLKTLKLFYKLDQGCFAHDLNCGGLSPCFFYWVVMKWSDNIW